MAADPTPTEVGTIFARLRMQADEFYADIERVKQATRDVGRESPTIRVTADTGEALAALAEVQAAADAAGSNSGSVRPAAETPSAPSSGGSSAGGGTARLTTAEAATRRLTAAQDALAAAENRAAAARQRMVIADTAATAAGEAAEAASNRTRRNEEEIAAATNRATAANARAEIADLALVEAERRVEAAKRKVAEASLAEAAAQETANVAAETGAKGGGRGGGGYLAIIAGIVAALIPLLAPLGGYLIGVAGGFTLMGAAGVAAILGIKNEMANGTAVGEQYSAGLTMLQGGLTQIEQTGAVSVLRGFQSAVAAVQAAMPFLNSETRTFGGLLGNTVALSVQALVSLLHGLNPLLIGGAQAVQGFARGLVDLGNSQGLAQFADYATRMLPTVGAFLGHILSTIGNLVAATAPLGQVMMVALNGVLSVVDVLSSLGPVFPTVVAGALSLWGAFALYGKVGPLLNTAAGGVLKLLGFLGIETGVTVANTAAKEENAAATEAMAAAEDVAAVSSVALGGALDFAAGPIGWVVGGIAALVAVLGTVAAASSDAAASTTDYTAAIQADNGVIGENTQKTAENALAKSGAVDAAKKLGIGVKTLTDAATGNAAAQKQVNAAIAAQNLPVNTATAAHSRFHRALSDSQQAAIQVRDAMSGNSASMKAAIKAYNDLQTALGGTTIKTGAQLAQQKALAAGLGMSLPTYQAAQAANQKVADQAAAAAAQMQLEGDYAGLLKTQLDALNGKSLTAAQAQGAWASALDAAKAGINATSKSLDGNTRAGQENQAQLAQIIGTGETAIEQYANTAKSQDAVTKRYQDMKRALIDQMVANGEDRSAVTKLVNEWFKMPKHVTTKYTFDGNAAQAAAAGIIKTLNGIPTALYTTDYLSTKSVGGAPAGIAAPQRFMGGSIPKHAVTGATAVNTYTGTVTGNGGSLMDQAGLWALANGEEIISNRTGQADRNRPLLKAINAGAVFAPAGSVAAAQPQKNAPQRVVHVGGVHLHSPVAQDPVQAAEDASQLIAAYAAFPG